MKRLISCFLGKMLFLVTALTANTVQAQMIGMCEGSALAPLLDEMHEDAGRRFADGAIRVMDVYIDSNLPNAVLIAVLHPAPSELAGGGVFTRCSAVYSTRNGPGFFGQVLLDQADASYDPEVGLTLQVPVRYYYSDRAVEEDMLTLIINQSTGYVDARMP
ncbi:hypothetical protein [Roseovarius sp. 2305UL8-3]|uniref:hypothetical protein n=1 Tax=Roseovarius conchicola TaxID=3121636 RepID=UPI0035285954